MESSTLIRKIHMDCPLCDKTHEVEERKRIAAITFKGDEAYDTILRLIKDNPLQALEFLKKNAEKFSGLKRREIRSKIVEKLDSYGKEFLTRQTFEGEYANYEEPSDANGFTVLNID